jgi:hypothetical protein
LRKKEIRVKIQKTGVWKRKEESITMKSWRKQINKRRKKIQKKVEMDRTEERQRRKLESARENE